MEARSAGDPISVNGHLLHQRIPRIVFGSLNHCFNGITVCIYIYEDKRLTLTLPATHARVLVSIRISSQQSRIA